MIRVIISLLFVFTLSSTVSAKEYIREAYVALDLNKSLLTPIEQAKKAIREDLLNELWSLNARNTMLSHNENNEQFTLTDSQKSSLIIVNKVLEIDQFENVFYIKAKVNVKNNAFSQAFKKNSRSLKSISKVIRYEGNSHDSKPETFRRAINSAKMDVLTEREVFVKRDVSVIQNGLTEVLSDQIETFTQGLVKVKTIDNVKWVFNTISFKVTFEVFEDGLTERWHNSSESLIRTFDNYSYTKASIKPYKALPASPLFIQGVHSLQLATGSIRSNGVAFGELSTHMPGLRPFLNDAIKNNDVDSMTILCAINSYYYIEKLDTDLHDFSWCYKAAVNGSSLAQLVLGHYLISGKGITEDRESGFYWLNKGMNSLSEFIKTKGNKSSIYLQVFLESEEIYFQLAKMYEQGAGVNKNMPMAINYYKQCGQLSKHNPSYGSVYERCRIRLGDIYAHGIGGVKVDFEQAAHWYGSYTSSALAKLKATNLLKINRHPDYHHLDDLKRKEYVEHWIKNAFTNVGRIKSDAEFNEADAYYAEYLFDTSNMTDEALGRIGTCVDESLYPACFWRFGQYLRSRGKTEQAMYSFQKAKDLGSTLAYKDHAILISDSLRYGSNKITTNQVELMNRMLRVLSNNGDLEMRKLWHFWINKYEALPIYVNKRKELKMDEFVPYVL
jgi:hypothetical protein